LKAEEVKEWHGKIMCMICRDAPGVPTASGYLTDICGIPISLRAAHPYPVTYGTLMPPAENSIWDILFFRTE
jgi:hypothetical protein